MKWKFGVRRLRSGKLIITEEFGKKYGYAIVGVLDDYSPKELKMLAKDLLKAKIGNDDGVGVYSALMYNAANPE